ncbi:AT-hook motif nuclear-localized protein 1 [Morus notabilis]|uniref:AT-hook motif nuclear-localized protein 1 n=1 Tax=Morus notabilis TaxID=981085 RepID=UPI000CED76E2|nr:AT-hook motif nuclear-localized protein 1 [Morus notabilis]
MDSREGISSGVTVIGAEAPSAYHVAPRMENPGQPAGGDPITPSPVSAGLAANTGKKKRGRPRKYGPDGTVTMALSPMPISSSAPPSGEFSSGKRGKARSSGFEYKQHKKVGLDHFSGEWNSCSLGTNFMPHIITVNAGEDVTMKVISFSQQGPRAICILSANGLISNVTLRQHDSSGGTLTYEGRFEILSLSGSFMPTETQGTRSRQGGMSVSLASPDGRVVGGGVAGLLVAASPVQVVVGSFLPSNQQEPKPKKLRTEHMTVTPGISMVPPVAEKDQDGMSHGHGHQNSSAPRPNLASSAPFQRENWPAMNSMHDSRNSATDINISLPGG